MPPMSGLRGTIDVFKHVCLGGTFDGIHAGHKLLFSEAIKICNERLVVGVTDANMVKSKILWELIAPVQERCQRVQEYLQELNPRLNYQVVAIQDLYGPTITDPSLECIVISRETLPGAQKINTARVEKGWPELKVHVVDLVEEEQDSNQELLKRLKEHKVSSSLLRMQKLGELLRPPKANKNIPDRPYLIGLTGGIASGKTAIGQYLESLGFGYINYDLLGHKTYAEVGSATYRRIVDHFGPSILAEDKHIDRARLGKIVFSDRSQLDVLNGIVWPAIYSLVDQEIERLKTKHEVIVLESALLLESGQDVRVHQVWTAIIPPEEAIERQIRSRGLSREEAERRVRAQQDNLSRIERSNVVFCSLWEAEFTRRQVRKAADQLRVSLGLAGLADNKAEG